MIKKQDGGLGAGVSGCGPIAGSAHLESSMKAANAGLCAIRDTGRDLLAGIAS